HGLGGKSMALAGKAASFGVRFKLAIATMSVVTVGGLGVTAGPLLLHTTSLINADRGIVQELPVLPYDGGASTGQNGMIQHPFGPGLPPESTGTEIMGPRGHQQGQHSPSTSTQTLSSLSNSTEQSSTEAATHTSESLQEQTSGSSQQPMSQQLAPNTDSRNVKTITPTTDPATTQATTGVDQPQESVWSTEYTTDGTTVWITRWTEVWQDTQGPPGR
ncbi:MAG TPA: hypothetical protein VGN81_11210, partial [Pseudonocardiaceae bacterium]